MEKGDRVAAIFKALSHPLRLEIVRRLGDGETCACEIAEWFESDRTTVSKHLAVLRDSGVLYDRKDGAKVFYGVSLSCVSTMIRCVEATSCGCSPERKGNCDDR